MSSRRLIGKTTSIGLMGTALLLLSGCDDGVADYAEVCATNTNPPIRVEMSECDDPAKAQAVGKYHWQLPPTSNYSDDGGESYYSSFNAIVIPNTGQPISGYGKGPAPVSNPARAIKPPSVSPGGSTISRGGLGVSGFSSSAGS